MLVPSTITARRTRRYTSTLYIRHTAHRLDFKPMDGGGRSSFQLPHVSNLPARAVHFTSAVYTLPHLPSNTDSLALPKEASEAAFGELGQRIDRMIVPGLRRDELEGIAVWDGGPEAFKNMLAVLVAEAARKQSGQTSPMR